MDSYNLILDLIEQQERWRSSCLNMIASENIVSDAVKKAVSSDFGHRYAEGLLGGKIDGMQMFNRFYQGTKIFDKAEATAMMLSEKLFQAEHANMVPISGAGFAKVNMDLLSVYDLPVQGHGQIVPVVQIAKDRLAAEVFLHQVFAGIVDDARLFRKVGRRIERYSLVSVKMGN